MGRRTAARVVPTAETTAPVCSNNSALVFTSVVPVGRVTDDRESDAASGALDREDGKEYVSRARYREDGKDEQALNEHGISILMGNENSATTYLQTSTTTPLYAKFNPVIKNSFSKVGADKVWASIIKKYNSIPMVEKVNPDLTDYTTNKALEGVFKMIAVEEKSIRTDLKSRTSPLLLKVFAMQDKIE